MEQLHSVEEENDFDHGFMRKPDSQQAKQPVKK